MKPCANTSDQIFVFDPASGSVKHGESSCLSVGDDVDRDAGTPAIEVQPCGAGRQGWQLDPHSGNLHPGGDAKHCVDIDHKDHMAELYSCYSPPTINQRWTFQSDGSGVGHHSGVFASMLDGG